MMAIFYSPTFAKHYRKLPANIKAMTEGKEEIFRQNPFDPQLKTHRLAGKLKGYWAFSIGYHYRIIFSFLSSGEVRFHTVGTHEIYQRFERGL